MQLAAPLAVAASLAVGCAAQAQMAPARPMSLPAQVKFRLFLSTQSDLSRLLNRTVTLNTVYVYAEQDGHYTKCGTGQFGVAGKLTRFVSSSGAGLKIAPTKAEWEALGCSRPDYLTLRG